MWPVLRAYSSWEYRDIETQNNAAFTQSLGNFGASEKRCLRVQLASDQLTLRCSQGQITDIPYWGVYQLGSPEETEGICDTKASNRCP